MDLKKIEEEYTRYKPHPLDGECVTDVYQRSFRDSKDRRKYFLTWKKYDFNNYIPSHEWEEPRYEGTTQLTYKKNGRVIEITFLNGWEVEDAENFMEQIFSTGLFNKYDEEVKND